MTRLCTTSMYSFLSQVTGASSSASDRMKAAKDLDGDYKFYTLDPSKARPYKARRGACQGGHECTNPQCEDMTGDGTKNTSSFVIPTESNVVTCKICKLSKLSANGKDQIVKLVKAGELLGQRSMISDEPANLSAVALEDMEVCFIPKSEVLNFFDNNNQFSMNLMKTICGDLKETSEHLVSVSQKTVKERLAETLIYLQDTFGKVGYIFQ